MPVFIQILFIITFSFSIIEGNLFLWSNRPFEISTLKYFDNAEFAALQQTLNNPKIIVFKGSLKQISPLSFTNKYTAYVPNGHLDFIDKIGK